jgi:thiol-disulfide isomerase/thioredoxin
MKIAALLLFTAVSTVSAGHISTPYFAILDRNHDGLIQPEEVERNAWAKRLDTDGTGGVSPAELAAGWDQFPALRAGLVKMFPEAGAAAPPSDEKGPQASPRQTARILAPAEHRVGTFIPDLKVLTLDGQLQPLSAFAKGKPLVIANFSPSCPVSKRYLPTLLAMEKQNPGINFLYLATNKSDSTASLREHLQSVTIARDPDGGLLRALGAQTTTDCYLLDVRRTLQYRGAIDDQYGLGYSLDAPRTRFLSEAIAAVKEGRTPVVAATEAPGCELDLSAITPAKAATITFHNRVSRLLQQHCQECHRNGGVAPFPLETLEQVGEHAGMIRKMVSQGLMPPWFAAPQPAGKHSPWLNDRSLPTSDREDLLAWLGNGRPAGDEKDAPLPRTWPKGEWGIGNPDAIIQIPQPIAVKATGTMPYQIVRVPTTYAESRYVTAIEILPTAREVVHHVLVFADEAPGVLKKLQRVIRRNNELRGEGDEDESGGFFGIYVPGNSFLEYPEGFAKVLPAGATLRFQIHYTPNGKATQDQVRVGLKFAEEKPRHVVMNAGISNHRLAIPAGADNHPVEARLPVPRDAVVMAFLPHMHLRGKAWRYEGIQPGQKPQVLLDVPRYDFNWQLLYRFAEPMRLPAGSVIKATGWYDNSAGNPANPDPGKIVKWGPQTTDEMMLGYVEYYFPE